MKILLGRLILGCMGAASLLLAGCDDHAGGSASKVNAARSTVSTTAGVPNLEGAWHGKYATPTSSESLEADVQQSGRRVEIVTSKDGEAHRFEGAFREEDNVLDMTDQETGEEWTSYGKVTKSHFEIRDFLWDDGAPHDPDNVQIVDLSR